MIGYCRFRYRTGRSWGNRGSCGFALRNNSVQRSLDSAQIGQLWKNARLPAAPGRGVKAGSQHENSNTHLGLAATAIEGGNEGVGFGHNGRLIAFFIERNAKFLLDGLDFGASYGEAITKERQMTPINEATAIRLYDHPEGGDVLAETTLGEFWSDNEDGIDQSERTTMRLILRVNGVYHGGGGAGAAWRIEVA